MQQVICDVPFRDEFIVRWRFQLRKNHSVVSTFVPRGEKTLVEKGSRRRGQRKARLSESQPTLVTLFHLFPVGAKKKKKISELIHPFLKSGATNVNCRKISVRKTTLRRFEI